MTESCGCVHGVGDEPSAVKHRSIYYTLGAYDDKPSHWIVPCELHERFGRHREMYGVEKGQRAR